VDSAAPSPPAPEFTAPAAQAAPPEPAPTTTESLAPAAPVTLTAAMPEKNVSRPVLTGGEVTRSPAPNYPRRARMRGIEGQVTVRCHVDTRGRVGEIEVLSARPAGTFDKAVTKAVRKWRHEPFMAAGQRVAQAVTQTFDFGIRREEVVAGKDENAAACRRVTGSRLCRSGDAYQELGVVVVQNPL
jgi:protein TonB